jgi:hypothetical protein
MGLLSRSITNNGQILEYLKLVFVAQVSFPQEIWVGVAWVLGWGYLENEPRHRDSGLARRVISRCIGSRVLKLSIQTCCFSPLNLKRS